MMEQEMEPKPSAHQCLSDSAKKRIRMVAYLITFLSTFSLGVTEIFASWYAGILGATPYEMGWAMGSFGLVYMFSPAVGGKVSDRIGRRNSLLIAVVAYIAVLFLYPQPLIMPLHLIIIRGLEGLFFGLFNPTIEAMVAELCPQGQAAVLGNFSTSWSAGMIMSPYVIAFMATNFGNVSSIFVVLAVEFSVLGIIALMIQDYRVDVPSAQDTAESGSQMHRDDLVGTAGSIRGQRTSPRFVASYISLMLFGFVSTVLLALFPTYIDGLPGYSPQDFGNLLLVWNVARTLAFITCSKLPHEQMSTVIITGAFLITASMVPLSFFTDIALFTVAMVLCGIGAGFTYLGALYSVVSATKKEKGARAGIVESLAGVGFFVGPIVGGRIGDFGQTLPYFATFLFALVSSLLIVVLLRKRPNSNQ